MTRKELIALDKKYQAWVRTQKSCISGQSSHWHDIRGWLNPSCHVRRARHAGTAHKPLFWAVPMTNDEHAIQSKKGELCVLLAYETGPQTVIEAKDWFDNQVAIHQQKFMAETGLIIPAEYCTTMGEAI